MPFLFEEIKGLKPTKTLFTSLFFGLISIYLFIVFKIKSISIFFGLGSITGLSMSVSVVPSSTCPSHGTAKSILPSEVLGTSIPKSPFKNFFSTTK